jgi:hypothetical protein
MVFCRYLLEGFRRESSRFGKSFQRLLEEEPRTGEPSPERLAGTLANELAALKGRPYLLVLDDFHEVAGSPAVTAIVDALVAQLPRTVRIVIAARSMPPLAVDRLRARGELGEIDSSDLRLTRAELERLFHDVYRHPVTAEELTALTPQLKGAIVMTQPILTNFVRKDRPQPSDPDYVPMSAAYATSAGRGRGPAPVGETPQQRNQRVTAAMKAAGAAVMLKPSTGEHGTVFVTGRDEGPGAVPSVTLSAEHYNMIVATCAGDRDARWPRGAPAARSRYGRRSNRVASRDRAPSLPAGRARPRRDADRASSRRRSSCKALERAA